MLRLFDNDKEIVFDINTYITEVFPLENFSAFGLIMDGKFFKTGEHAFQYLKFTDKVIQEKILSANNPYDARIIGGGYKLKRIPNWKDIKYEYLEKVFYLKVKQDPIVKKCLLNTKEYKICEYCVDEDTEWGLDKNGLGENRLGKAWMNVREKIRKEE